ncbi:uncharacterized protein BT62DRAFT_1009148 [Guyanagaster necrorhizus]|uniref:Uncharacterized protein n=1 Tax=Guyanagaster necrorhizus TaxID=856835 RepID=A0A9P7VN30_9AGAR|nr:uncharacterized protein BT62DRAFT_1009148 [Guyanagaster necrorhizus MCA 3950]KAG7443355.1 hypothetical protein BT62DRAFT_1009148 [Guyanagaster necrorhizus MCA 3950]
MFHHAGPTTVEGFESFSLLYHCGRTTLDHTLPKIGLLSILRKKKCPVDDFRIGALSRSSYFRLTFDRMPSTPMEYQNIQARRAPEVCPMGLVIIVLSGVLSVKICMLPKSTSGGRHGIQICWNLRESSSNPAFRHAELDERNRSLLSVLDDPRLGSEAFIHSPSLGNSGPPTFSRGTCPRIDLEACAREYFISFNSDPKARAIFVSSEPTPSSRQTVTVTWSQNSLPILCYRTPPLSLSSSIGLFRSCTLHETRILYFYRRRAVTAPVSRSQFTITTSQFLDTVHGTALSVSFFLSPRTITISFQLRQQHDNQPELD